MITREGVDRASSVTRFHDVVAMGCKDDGKEPAGRSTFVDDQRTRVRHSFVHRAMSPSGAFGAPSRLYCLSFARQTPEQCDRSPERDLNIDAESTALVPRWRSASR